MSKTVIQLNNGELDLAKEVAVALQYSIGEIQAPEKRNSNYSKSITLAFTKNNHKLLGHLFDINEDFTFFNPNIKTEAKVVTDSTITLDGYLQLVSIEKDNSSDLNGNNGQYIVTIFDEQVDLFKSLGDKLLSELDFSDDDHILNYTNITNTFSTGRDYKDVYSYPMLWHYSDTYKTSDWKPAIYHKAYLNKIAADNGFILSGTFMDNEDYEKELIPFTGEQIYLTDTERDRRLFRAGMSTTPVNLYTKEILGGLVINNGGVINSGLLTITDFDDDSTAPNFDPNGHYNTATGEYIVDRNGSFNLSANFNIDVNFTTERDIGSIANGGGGKITVTSNAHNLQDGATVTIMGTTSYNGTYTISGVTTNTFDCTVAYVANESGTYGVDAWQMLYRTINVPVQQESARIFNSPTYYSIGVVVYRNGQPLGTSVGNTQVEVPRAGYNTTDVTFSSANNFTESSTYDIALERNGVELFVGDVITLKLQVSSNTSLGYLKYIDGSTLTDSEAPVDVTFNLVQNRAGIISHFKNESNATVITDGDEVKLNNYIPSEIKQKDVFIDIIKRYNVYISPSLTNKTELILDSRDDYYNKGGILDWTNKKDYSKPDKIKLLSELQNKEMIFTYSEGDDLFNEIYTKSVSGDIYGQKTIEFTNEFTEGEKIIETPFVSTPLGYNSPNAVCIIPTVDLNEPSDNIRVLYYKGNIDTLNNKAWTFRWINAGVPTNTTLTQYPYSGHFDDPINPTLNINFGELPFVYYSELAAQTNNNLYNRFWRNYVNQIAEGRLVTSKFYLTEVDISYIKDNLNSKIFIKDSYYYINSIKDFDPTTKKSTTVELLKIVDGTTFTGEVETTTNPLTSYEGNVRSNTKTDSKNALNNVDYSEKSITSGASNRIGTGSESSIITGSNNEIGENSTDSGILGGSGNKIASGVNGSFVISADNKTITEDNVIWIGDTKIKEGVVQSIYSIVDAGEDRLLNLFTKSLITTIDGGEDELRAINTVSTVTILDGGEIN